ncbi:hypothetical protein ACKKBF_B33040 [Auxenochlorella protothecoides x Auxenochlorella symbiontica]
MPDSGSTDPDPLCTIAAAELLNCVASREHDTTKCEAQLKALRACTRKQNVVDFKLSPVPAKSN